MRYVAIAKRKNPELNKKISAYEALLPYSKRNDVYISFTDIDKLGVNPQSVHGTPLGIYCYPLKEAWTQYKIGYNESLRDIPFAGDRPYVWILQPTNKSTFVEDMYSCYGSNKFDKDLEKLRLLWKQVFVKKEHWLDPSLQEDYESNLKYIADWKKKLAQSEDGDKGLYKNLQKNIDHAEAENVQILKDRKLVNPEETWETVYEHALKFAKEKNPIMSFWNLTRNMAHSLVGSSVNNISSATKWNWLLRQCGYSGFADKRGRGYIHPSEPMQAVFLSRSDVKVIDKIQNKEYRTAIYNSKTAITDMNTILDYIQSDRKNWLDNSANTDYLFMFLAEQPTKPNKTFTIKHTAPELWMKCNPEHYEFLLRLFKKFEDYLTDTEYNRLKRNFKNNFQEFSDKKYWPDNTY